MSSSHANLHASVLEAVVSGKEIKNSHRGLNLDYMGGVPGGQCQKCKPRLALKCDSLHCHVEL